MTSQINHLFRVLFFILAFAPFSLFAEQSEDLYNKGKAAYEKRDYVDALKYFYAYSIINQTEIEKHPDFKEKISSIIKISEVVDSCQCVSTSWIEDRRGSGSGILGSGISGSGALRIRVSGMEVPGSGVLDIGVLGMEVPGKDNNGALGIILSDKIFELKAGGIKYKVLEQPSQIKAITQ